jgi:hypothetical protein
MPMQRPGPALRAGEVRGPAGEAFLVVVLASDGVAARQTNVTLAII